MVRTYAQQYVPTYVRGAFCWFTYDVHPAHRLMATGAAPSKINSVNRSSIIADAAVLLLPPSCATFCLIAERGPRATPLGVTPQPSSCMIPSCTSKWYQCDTHATCSIGQVHRGVGDLNKKHKKRCKRSTAVAAEYDIRALLYFNI